MDDSPPRIVEPPLRYVDYDIPKARRTRTDRPLVPPSIVQKMVERPVTTAAIFVLLGAFAAEGLALLFARAQARNALERSAIRNLRLAQRLDPRGDPLA